MKAQIISNYWEMRDVNLNINKSVLNVRDKEFIDVDFDHSQGSRHYDNVITFSSKFDMDLF